MPDFRLPKSLEFTAEDFASPIFRGESARIHPQRAADRANALLTERLAKCETVYGQSPKRSPLGTLYHPDVWVKDGPRAAYTHATKILPPWELGKDGVGDE